MSLKKGVFALTACLMVLAYVACDDEDSFKPTQSVEEALTAKYPSAKNISWEQKFGYTVAECFLDSVEAEVWFNTQSSWVMTEFDITFNMLPTKVKAAFDTCQYSSWKVDDVDRYVRPDTTDVYLIELEKSKNEVGLFYNDSGTLLKTIIDENIIVVP